MENNLFASGETRTMAAAFQKRMPVTTFLRDTFFGGVFTSPSDTIDMDFYKNRQMVAPFVADGVQSVNMRRDAMLQKQYKPPMLAPSRVLDPAVIAKRGAGENPYSPMTDAERARLLLQRDYNELSDAITRAEEKMVAELLQTGKIIASGYVDDSMTAKIINTIDFNFSNTITVAAASKWDASTPGAPEATIDTAAEMVRKGGYDPTVVILGRNAARAMLSNEKFMKTQFDLSRVNMGYIDPAVTSVSGNGYTLLGMLKRYNLYIYQYDAYYYDAASSTLKPYVDPDTMIIGARDIGEMCYGAITMIDEASRDYVTFETTRAPKLTVNEEADIKKLTVKSRPIPKPNDVASWAVAKVTGE